MLATTCSVQVVGRGVAECNPGRVQMLVQWNMQALCCASVDRQSVSWFLLQIIAHISAFVCERCRTCFLSIAVQLPMCLEGLLVCAGCESGFLSSVGVISDFHRNPQQIDPAVIP